MNELNWWDSLLQEREHDGKTDADVGDFNPPYPGRDDPQYEEENEAYKRGFKKRRLELGERFHWS